ncbi:sodium/potassium/calcium exchanger 1 [Misgurnus anguillicaudatus]|uniref:sodium/potassium/calcium exchanger 1 n=1 Tax=Misgurnus anguillicaudatus TaxID=75329 RepID=UPI003CCF4D41
MIRHRVYNNTVNGMNQSNRRRLRSCKTLSVILVTLVCWICWVSVSMNHEVWKRTIKEEETDLHSPHIQKSSYESRTDLAMSPSIRIHKDYSRCIYIEPNPNTTANSTQTSTSTKAPTEQESPPRPGEAPHRTAYYPEDLFTLEERRHGWVLLHISAMIYMFLALVIVCEEFLVPALGILTEKLHIPEDLAGVNFMAAGGFAPGFFISLVGLFLSSSNVGIGVVVGSGFFNILAVMGAFAVFSDESLSLTWWPLFRDVTFYTCDLFILLGVFLDDIITWWEIVLLLLGCLVYVTVIKYNELLEEIVTFYLQKHNNIAKVLAIDEPEKLRCDVFRGRGSDSLRNCTSRKTVYQLIIDATNPLREGVSKKKHDVKSVPSNLTEASRHDNEEQQTTESESSEEDEEEDDDDNNSGDDDSDFSSDEEDSSGDDDDECATDLALSLKWPDEKRKQAPYVVLLPITGCLWLTLPDPHRQASKQYFMGTLFGSFLWIGLFSYFLLCLSHRVCETLGLSEDSMALTVLAAGVSVPNLLTAVIMAHKGLGGTAVSYSVGTNVFDVTVGLPVSWLMLSVFSRESVLRVNSNGIFFIILLMIFMLISGVSCIAAFHWRMNKRLGCVMLMSYFLFLFLSVMLV